MITVAPEIGELYILPRTYGIADGLPDGPNANTKVLRGNDLKNMTQAQQDAFVKQINESLDYTG